VVQSGPFRGMFLIERSRGSVWIPKLLGAYESELTDVIEWIIDLKPDRIIDIGSAEGYFAVGFAYRIAQVEVIAADTNPLARSGVRKMAQMNKLNDRVKVVGWISQRTLESALANAVRPVVWCDIEGGEAAFLSPERMPSLKKTYMVIEEHRFISGVSFGDILRRFNESHFSSIVTQVARKPEEWIPQELADLLTSSQKELALNELRPNEQCWLVLTPKSDCE